MSEGLDTGDEPRRRSTATSNFGVGKREGHDAGAFYARFTPPALSDDDHANPPKAKDVIWVGDSRDMDTFGDIADSSVALVVTSSPNFAGQSYEEALGPDGIPADYTAYLRMHRALFDECVPQPAPGRPC